VDQISGFVRNAENINLHSNSFPIKNTFIRDICKTENIQRDKTLYYIWADLN